MIGLASLQAELTPQGLLQARTANLEEGTRVEVGGYPVQGYVSVVVRNLVTRRIVASGRMDEHDETLEMNTTTIDGLANPYED